MPEDGVPAGHREVIRAAVTPLTATTGSEHRTHRYAPLVTPGRSGGLDADQFVDRAHGNRETAFALPVNADVPATTATVVPPPAPGG